MWSSLKSDLEELVSVVKEDTNIVLEKIAEDNEAKKASAAAKEAERRMSNEETFTIPLLKGTNVSSLSGSVDSSFENDSADQNQSADSDAEISRVDAFLKSLNINDRTDEISNLLEKHPNTLRLHFGTLVPEVIHYEDFWERFFYRCDEKQIEREWEEEHERARKARAELVGSVSNFFGVAAKAVASSVSNALTEDDAGNPGKAKSLVGLFGPSARPPFVMNTALDEDDDEEEVLGWDDDEDDEEQLSAGLDSSSRLDSTSRQVGEEEIQFKDVALEAVEGQLKQAIEERDQLHETIALQTKEIVSLKSGNDSSSQVVMQLRAELKAKETELYTLKQETESEMMKSTATDDQGVNLAAKVKHLTSLLSTKDLQLSKAQGTYTTNIKELDDKVVALKKENELLRQKLVEVATESTAQLKLLEEEVNSLKVKVAALEAELETTRSSLTASQKEGASLKAELEGTKKVEQSSSGQHATNLEDDAASGTPDSVSTGVKVDKPYMVSKISTDEDEDAWGDEWD